MVRGLSIAFPDAASGRAFSRDGVVDKRCALSLAALERASQDEKLDTALQQVLLQFEQSDLLLVDSSRRVCCLPHQRWPFAIAPLHQEVREKTDVDSPTRIFGISVKSRGFVGSDTFRRAIGALNRGQGEYLSRVSSTSVVAAASARFCSYKMAFEWLISRKLLYRIWNASRDEQSYLEREWTAATAWDDFDQLRLRPDVVKVDVWALRTESGRLVFECSGEWDQALTRPLVRALLWFLQQAMPFGISVCPICPGCMFNEGSAFFQSESEIVRCFCSFVDVFSIANRKRGLLLLPASIPPVVLIKSTFHCPGTPSILKGVPTIKKMGGRR